MTLKLGISIYSIPNLSVDNLLEIVHKHHFSAIELWSSSFVTLKENFKDLIINRELSLSIHAPLLNLGIKNESKDNINILRETIFLAKQYKARTIVLHTGERDPRASSDFSKNIEIAKQVINTHIDILHENDIHLSIENVGYSGKDLITNFQQLSNFVDSFSDPVVSITFDLAHANITEGVEKGISTLGHRINHLHLSNNFGQKNQHHKPLDTGNIDFTLLNRLSMNDEISAILEIEPLNNWKKNLHNSRILLQNLGII